MSFAITAARKLARIFKDRSGNFGIATAVILPVFLASGGVAIDLAQMVSNKTRLQDAADAAALAASSVLAGKGATQAEARLLAQKYVAAQMNAEGLQLDELNIPVDFAKTTTVLITETAQTGSGKSFKVTVNAQYKHDFNAMTRLLGQTSITLNAAATADSATESKNALSMYLVLDRSGSMAWKTTDVDKSVFACYTYQESNWNTPNWTIPCYKSKMATLKLSVANLLTQLNIADPTATLVRTGAVSYNLSSDPASKLNWGTAAVMTQVNLLIADGGTDSSDAFQNAYDKLMVTGTKGEDSIHDKQNGQVPTKYIVFMTDGENNNTSADTETKATCDLARKAGIQVYTVAFMAPTRGQNLLKYCATTSQNYFAADNADDLVDAFKYIGQRTAAMVSRLTK
ncbi:vWA domain-containing protein [Pararhizobium sp.]|uniref:vWA domain-containing protein n=1 Tax=Pararhizobium sp. TaxID=1977563 RepID=UPI002725CDE7|nr:TadE/TadG family type IV pilus assembly protein [Pararhizobium sp.]MDO9415211.1 VWA domain-containing protein [Pararhizobium sp.]